MKTQNIIYNKFFIIYSKLIEVPLLSFTPSKVRFSYHLFRISEFCDRLYFVKHKNFEKNGVSLSANMLPCP